MFCGTPLHRSFVAAWPIAGYRKPAPMEQIFRRAHEMLLATTCQLCCTLTTSLNSIKRPCSCKQGRHPGWDLNNWDLYCIYLQSRPGFGFGTFYKQHIHTPQDARPQVISCIFFFFFFSSPDGCCFSQWSYTLQVSWLWWKAELDGKPNVTTNHGTVIHHLMARNRHSCLGKCTPSHIIILKLLLNAKDKAFHLLSAFSHGQHYCSVMTLWVTK